MGAKVSVQIKAKDSAKGQTLSYSARSLPKGLRLNHSTGLITGSPARSGKNTVIVTVKDSTGASGKTTFLWTHK